LKKRNIIIGVLFCLAFGVTALPAQTNADTTKQLKDTLSAASNNKVLQHHIFNPVPSTAFKLALIPGLGQIYNRKYWKLPIVYGGFLGLGYAISWNNSYYNEYKMAYSDIIDNDNTTNSFVNFIPAGYTAQTVDKTWLASVLSQKKDDYRRYRDLTIIGTVAFYALTILDAYVDAQMYDFDISPDLSMRIEPSLLKTQFENSASLGVCCRLNF
jgi:hypothetical protein